MSCCCPHTRDAGRYFSWFAGSYCRRFRKKGFESSQRQLLAGLEQQGFQDATVLEIGSGVGHLHMTLLEQGAGSAVGVDLSPRMLDLARGWAAERGLADRVAYVEGDFVEKAETFEAADVTVLDKVICCYPDARALVDESLAKTRRVYAITLPRKRWYMRVGIGFTTTVMRVIGSGFRPYLHDPAEIEAWAGAHGFEKAYEATTLGWLTQLYVRG